MNQATMTHTNSSRLVPLDALRGLLMIFMAVDHANFFVSRAHPTGEFWGIPLPQYESFLAFLTRLVTQPCAPGFFLLLGVGMVLFAHSRQKKEWPYGMIRKHLIIRGSLLILMQFFLENTAWLMGPANTIQPPGGGGEVWLHFGVLFGLGAAMILGSLIMRLPAAVLLVLGFVGACLTQVLTPDAAQADELFSPLLRILFIPGKTGMVQVFYAALPWLSFVCLGLVFGKWFVKDEMMAYRRALVFGGVFLCLFIPFRQLGSLANFHLPASLSPMDYLNVTKYPPSLSFSLLTLSVVLLSLFVLYRGEKLLHHRLNPLLVFGRSALFFYILHLYIFACMGLVFAGRGGTSLSVMYGFWLAGLILLYPLCLWYGNFKRKKPLDSIWRFF
jgi:uncharacterized membrane protein